MKRLLLCAGLLCAARAYALPDAPMPKVPPRNAESYFYVAGAPKAPIRWHQFYDRQAKITLAVELSLNAADQVQTCTTLARGGREVNLPTESCAGIVGLNVGMLAAGEGLAYLLHRAGHHKLERLPRWYLIYGNVYGLVYSHAHGSF